MELALLELAGLATDELVIRSSNDRDVRNFRIRFLAPNWIEMAAQEWQVVRRWEDVIVGEPDGPKTAGKPTVSLESFGGMLASGVKIDDANQASRLKHSKCVFNSAEPIGNHRQ